MIGKIRVVPRFDGLLLMLDLTGIAVFALEGAMAAIVAGIDIFGVMVLAFATALGGGIIRDVLIGETPPASLRDWRYPCAAFIAGGVAFLFYGFAQRIPPLLLLTLDAAGLSLFAIAGTEKAVDKGISGFVAVLLGTITGVGGGTIRDVLLMQIPAVLRVDVYATAALAGSTVMAIAIRLGLPRSAASALGLAICFGLRMVAVVEHWNLPRLTVS
jgi:uncharacterized membrane protein YeiH